jgi:hypothetical protein
MLIKQVLHAFDPESIEQTLGVGRSSDSFPFCQPSHPLASRGSGYAEQNVARNSQLRAQSLFFTGFPFRLFWQPAEKEPTPMQRYANMIKPNIKSVSANAM